MTKLPKPSRRIVRALIFYFLGILLHLIFMTFLNKQHIENSYLRVINIGLFPSCYWGVICATNSKT